MIRVGIGYDVHQFAEERHLVLGGVEIQPRQGLKGHSDADVLLHAICDALLGAAGMGDIGHQFPDTDEKYRDISSKILLKEVVRILDEEKWSIVNIDAIVIMEEPHLEPFKDKIRHSIAEAAGIDPSRVTIKATTTERVGSIGRGEAAASEAVALLEKRK